MFSFNVRDQESHLYKSWRKTIVLYISICTITYHNLITQKLFTSAFLNLFLIQGWIRDSTGYMYSMRCLRDSFVLANLSWTFSTALKRKEKNGINPSVWSSYKYYLKLQFLLHRKCTAFPIHVVCNASPLYDVWSHKHCLFCVPCKTHTVLATSRLSVWKNLGKFHIGNFLIKSNMEVQVRLKLDKENSYFTWRPMQIWHLTNIFVAE